MRNPSIKLLLASAVLAASFAACNDGLTNGNSIVDDQVNVFIDTTFTVSATTVDNNAVISRSITGLIGSIDAEGYGSLSSDFITQFMPANTMDTLGVTESTIDDISLVMRYYTDGFVGDSVAPMGVEVYPLVRQLPSPIYSDFDPSGYYDASQPLGSAIYTATRENLTDSLKKLNYNLVRVKLPVEMGRRLFNKFVEDPAVFSDPEKFAQFFPGLYIRNSYGSGRVMRVSQTTIDMRYHSNMKVDGKDTVINLNAAYLAVTPEIVCNNNIEYTISDDLRSRRAQGQTLLVAPAGYDAEITFPAREIISNYRNTIANGLGVINSLSFEIPAEEIANDEGITPPPYVLMVLKSKKDTFFNDNKITDNKTSFYAQYNSSTKSYDFGSMRDYLMDLINKEEISDEDITFIITPVNVATESNSDYYGGTSTYVTSITPYVVQPVMARLLIDKAKITFVYSRQTLAQ